MLPMATLGIKGLSKQYLYIDVIASNGGLPSHILGHALHAILDGCAYFNTV